MLITKKKNTKEINKSSIADRRHVKWIQSTNSTYHSPIKIKTSLPWISIFKSFLSVVIVTILFAFVSIMLLFFALFFTTLTVLWVIFFVMRSTFVVLVAAITTRPLLDWLGSRTLLVFWWHWQHAWGLGVLVLLWMWSLGMILLVRSGPIGWTAAWLMLLLHKWGILSYSSWLFVFWLGAAGRVMVAVAVMMMMPVMMVMVVLGLAVAVTLTFPSLSFTFSSQFHSKVIHGRRMLSRGRVIWGIFAVTRTWWQFSVWWW